MLNKWTIMTLCAGVAGLLSGAPAHADSLFVPQGVDVPLVFDQTISSRWAHPGDTVAMHVAANVVVDGHTIVRRGTRVTGLITGVRHRNAFGVNGHLRLAFHPVRSTYGKTIALEPRIAGKDSGSRADHAAEISGGAALVLGPVGLVGGAFVAGKNVTIHAGQHIMSEVRRDTYLPR